MSLFLRKVRLSLIWGIPRIRRINILGKILKVIKNRGRIRTLVKPLKASFLTGNKCKSLMKYWTNLMKYLDSLQNQRRSPLTLLKLTRMKKTRSKVTTMFSSLTILSKRASNHRTIVLLAGWMRTKSVADWNGDHHFNPIRFHMVKHCINHFMK